MGEDVVWHAFKKFDLDGSGAIDRTELKKVLGDDNVREAMHLEEDTSKLEGIFAEVDENGDGLIDFDEFFTMMKNSEAGGSPGPSQPAKRSSPRTSLKTSPRTSRT